MQGALLEVVKDAEAGYRKAMLIAYREGEASPVPVVYSPENLRCRELLKQGLFERVEKPELTYKLTKEGRTIAEQLEREMAAKV